MSVAVATGFTLIAWAGLSANVFGGWQLRFSDALFPGTGTDPRIVVVGVDSHSQTVPDLGQWPWNRAAHARITDNPKRAGAGLIVYDVVFNPETENDAPLAKAEAKAKNVILASFAEFEGRSGGDLLEASNLTDPVPELATAAAAIGHTNVTPDADGVTRSLPLVIDAGGQLIPSLSLQAYLATEGLSGPLTLRRDGIQAGGILIPTDRAQILDLNFADQLREGAPKVPILSAADVYAGNFDRAQVAGKVVFFGVTDPTLGDNKQTPVDKGSGLPGVFIHANALNTMLQGAFLTNASLPLTLATVFVVALLIALAVQFLPLWLAALTPILVGFAYLLYVFNRFDRGTVNNLVYPNLGIVVAFIGSLGVRYFTEVRERRRVTTAFGRYLAKDVVEEVLAAPEGPVATLKGVSRPLSILFADLRGFTSASENSPAADVVSALNIYLDAMTRAVIDEKGTIDKFMGDCVMAFWGAPRADPDYVNRCVRAAVLMQDYIDEAMRTTEASRLRVKGCGVGISAGDAVVGNIGSAERLDYTVIGDTVNTASRLCGVAGAGEIVVTEECAHLMSPEFRLGPLPPLSVKGKAKPLRVFQVLREGQEAAVFEAGVTLDATEEKGHFEPAPAAAVAAEPAGDGEAEVVQAPSKAAGYAPVEPVPGANAAERDPNATPSTEPRSAE